MYFIGVFILRRSDSCLYEVVFMLLVFLVKIFKLYGLLIVVYCFIFMLVIIFYYIISGVWIWV